MPPAKPASRTVTLVLVDSNGIVLGALRPFQVPDPWLQEAAPVVRAARERHGIEVTVLRMLSGTPGEGDGRVAYLAQVEGEEMPSVSLEPVDRSLDESLGEHPLRLPWARPNGPHEDVRWAEAVLAEHGLALSGPPEQVRTWNLSSLWRLPTQHERIWLKSVPPFFGHEARMLERLHDAPVPRLLAHDGARMLLHEVPSVDLYEATLEQRWLMVDQLVAIQREWVGRENELLTLGLPDWRADRLIELIADVVERDGSCLEPQVRTTLGQFVDGLPARFAALADCGVPDTLVHGDFHPGNHRGAGDRLVLLDWGDCGVGHPLLDQTAFSAFTPADLQAGISRRWQELWQAAYPASDAGRAAELLAPVAAARQAVIYRKFLDNIEPSETPYHASDPAEWLDRTARLLGA